jgi:hypothetical protein
MAAASMLVARPVRASSQNERALPLSAAAASGSASSLPAVGDHVQAQAEQQRKRDPVVPGLHVHRRCLAQQPAQHRRDGLDDTKDQPGTQGIGQPWAAHRHPLADRRGKGIGGHGKANQQDRKRGHGYSAVGRGENGARTRPTDVVHARRWSRLPDWLPTPWRTGQAC